jgi:hypothetical protein
MAILHTIKAALYDNALTENPNDFTARVQSERSLSVQDICELAATRGGADISASAMEHAVSLWLREMAHNLCDGFAVNAGWFTASVGIKGVFDSATETFNRDKHTVAFDFVQGAQLRRELENVTVEIVGVADAAPGIAQVTDVKSGSVNDLLTPNRNLRIAGSKIKVAGDHANNGVYFVNQATQERTRVEMSDVVTNMPSELIIVIPALAAGSYTLEVVTQYSGNSSKQLKEPRTAAFDKTLTVA